MAGLGLELFERRAEAFSGARSWREWMFLSGQRPGRGLVTLYDHDFPEFTSTDLWADLQAATPDDPRQLRLLSEVLASAHVEGKTREQIVRLTRTRANATVAFEDETLPWREAPARWPLLADVPRRHGLEEAWRATWKADLTPTLEHVHEGLRQALPALGANDWLGFWAGLRGIDPAQPAQLAEILLSTTSDVYTHGLSVYFGGLGLPLDDAWPCDADWAFRAARFDTVFGERGRMPLLIRVFRDLGIELTEQTAARLEYEVPEPGARVIRVDVPREVHVLQRLVGGWQDYANALNGLGQALHSSRTDPSLPFWQRSLGDQTPNKAYGRLFEGLLRDATWLTVRMDYVANNDFRVIGHLARLFRIRRLAAHTAYEQRVWSAEPGTSLAVEYEDGLTSATRVRHFGDDYLSLLETAPWSVLQPAIELRAEVFAAQLALFLRREFDDEWWRSNRAARFIEDELWRPGGRHSAEELLGFMGFEGLDPSILASEFEEVLRPL